MVDARQAQLRLVSSKLVKAPWDEGTTGVEPEVFHLSCCDQLSLTTATARATFWPDCRFDAAALERCLEAVLADLPLLSGRLTPLSWGLRLSTTHVALCNAGALLTVAEARGVGLDYLGPDSWVMRDIHLSTPALPFYVDALDTLRLLQGKEPLLKVRLTRVADGDILSITLAHLVTDGMRWPAFMAHFAARYREAATGVAPPPAALLRPGSRAELSAARLEAALHSTGGPRSKPRALAAPAMVSLGDYWRAGSVLLKDSFKRKDLLILHLPRERIQNLKELATAASGSGPALTTGDMAQALAGLLVSAAKGAPLLPLAPKYQVVLVQLQGAPAGYFGNAVHLLPVQVPAGAAAGVSHDDYMGALTLLASHIRQASLDFRAHPEASIAALREKEELVRTPVHRLVGWLAGRRLPNVTCTTNYVPALPADKALDFGLRASSGGGGGGGSPGPAAVRWLVAPFGSDMAVVRPAQPPYEEGLFLHLTLSAAEGRALRGHPLLRALVPEARFLGEPSTLLRAGSE